MATPVPPMSLSGLTTADASISSREEASRPVFRQPHLIRDAGPVGSRYGQRDSAHVDRDALTFLTTCRVVVRKPNTTPSLDELQLGACRVLDRAFWPELQTPFLEGCCRLPSVAERRGGYRRQRKPQQACMWSHLDPSQVKQRQQQPKHGRCLGYLPLRQTTQGAFFIYIRLLIYPSSPPLSPSLSQKSTVTGLPCKRKCRRWPQPINDHHCSAHLPFKDKPGKEVPVRQCNPRFKPMYTLS